MHVLFSQQRKNGYTRNTGYCSKGRFWSSSVNPSPNTSCTSVTETNACGSIDVIIFFKRIISFLPTTQYNISRSDFVKWPYPGKQ